MIVEGGLADIGQLLPHPWMHPVKYLGLFHVPLFYSATIPLCLLFSWCTHLSFCLSHFLLVISVSADLWLSWLCSYVCRQCPCTAASTSYPTHFSSSELRQELHVHPCWPSATHSCLPAHWKGPLSCSEETVLEKQPGLLLPFAPWSSFPWHAAKQVTEEAKACFSEVQDYNFAVSLTHFP